MREQIGRFVGFGIETETSSIPYLVERLMATVYRRRSVPAGLGRNDLIAWAGDRSVKTKRRMCLVFGSGDCVYLEPDGCWRDSSEPPGGGVVVENQ